MFQLAEKIDKAAELKVKCTLIDKMGKYHHGVMTDSWVRLSAGKMRGKVRFQTEKAELEIDANDILDILFEKT